MVRTIIAIVLGLAFYSIIIVLAASANDKVTFCHAAGRDGTTHFIELTTSYNAAFGQAGHFYENGTPRAGHEQDYLGVCNPLSNNTPTPITTVENTPTPTPIALGVIGEPVAFPNTGGHK